MIESSRTQHRFAQAFSTTAAVLLLGLLSAAGTLRAESAESWYLLEFADSKPPCLDVPAESRCIGTTPRTTTFEMRDGERIEMPTTSQLPPAWAAFEHMWIYAPAVAGSYGRRAIELTATPLGARLMIEDGEYQYLQSLPVSQWVALEAKNQPKLWVRVTPAS